MLTSEAVQATIDQPSWHNLADGQLAIVTRVSDKHAGKILGNGSIGETQVFAYLQGIYLECFTLSQFAAKFVKV